IDTNIIISYTKGYFVYLKELIEKQKKGDVMLFVNPVVVAEFFTDKNLDNEKKYILAKEFFHNFTSLPINNTIGIIAGKLLRNNSTIAIGDALIAATCLENKLELITNNIKDFKKVKGLKFYEEKGLIE
ncbi:MAG: PIN domain-containing protein, partial [Candidatus Roizmanbacteria bacterium]|nr:PIN domain-containing protein [Candidatus Roizmanbacteria bacterium]